jgi:tetratricopeptide (TPR) repeat protein
MKNLFMLLLIALIAIQPINAQEEQSYIRLLKNTRERIQANAAVTDTINAKYPEIIETLRRLIKENKLFSAMEMAHELTFFWEQTGRLTEGRTFYSSILNLPDVVGTDSLRGLVLLDEGYLAFRQGDNLIAKNKTLAAKTVFEGLKDSSAVARAYVYLARIELRNENHKEVENYANKAMAIAAAINADERKYGALHMLATSYEMQGKYEAAIKLYQEGLDHYFHLGDKLMVATEIYNIASNKIKLHKIEKADTMLRESLTIFQSLQDQIGIAYTIFKFATIASEQKLYSKAAKLYGATDSIFKALQINFDPAEEKDWKYYTDLTKKALGNKTYELLFNEGRLINDKDALKIILTK